MSLVHVQESIVECADDSVVLHVEGLLKLYQLCFLFNLLGIVLFFAEVEEFKRIFIHRLFENLSLSFPFDLLAEALKHVEHIVDKFVGHTWMIRPVMIRLDGLDCLVPWEGFLWFKIDINLFFR